MNYDKVQNSVYKIKSTYLGLLDELLPSGSDLIALGMNGRCVVLMDGRQTRCFTVQSRHLIFQSSQVAFHAFMFALEFISYFRARQRNC